MRSAIARNWTLYLPFNGSALHNPALRIIREACLFYRHLDGSESHGRRSLSAIVRSNDAFFESVSRLLLLEMLYSVQVCPRNSVKCSKEPVSVS
jgi:hypothetical protein